MPDLANRLRGAMHRLRLAVILASLLLAGCWPLHVPDVAMRADASTRGEVFASAKKTLPPLKEGNSRIYFYRTSFLVGFFAAPVVIVNGHWMGDKDDSNKNLFLPSSIFVVDTDAQEITAWVYQEGKERPEARISLATSSARTYWVKNKSYMTFVGLEQTNEKSAASEIEDLHFTGYADLSKR